MLVVKTGIEVLRQKSKTAYSWQPTAGGSAVKDTQQPLEKITVLLLYLRVLLLCFYGNGEGKLFDWMID